MTCHCNPLAKSRINTNTVILVAGCLPCCSSPLYHYVAHSLLLAKICKSARARDDRQWQLLFVEFAEVVIFQYEFSRQESDDFIPHVLPDR